MSGIDDCLRHAMAIPGAVGVSLVDYTTGLALSSAGAAPTGDPEAVATGAAEVVNAATERSPFVSTRNADQVDDIIITTTTSYHLVRPVRTVFDSRLVLYLWLDCDQGNLAIARRRLRMLAEELVIS